MSKNPDFSLAAFLRGEPGWITAFAVILASCCAGMSAGLALDLHSPQKATVSAHAAVADAFENEFHRLIKRDKLPGGAFVIVTPDSVVKLGTSGYVAQDNRQLIGADTVFRLASVSKTFAAELTAMLVDQGQLSWADPITSHLPEFRINGATNRITLADLLGQSTGIVGHAYDHMIEEGRLPDEILPKFAELSPVCQPGSCYTYQNVAFSLIEPAINTATQHGYADNLQQKIFDPLKMEQASVGLQPLTAHDNYARPHRKRGSGWREAPVLPTYYRISPAAGVNASIIDMARWLQAQLGAHPEVISPQLIALVSTPRVRTPQALRRRFWDQYLTDAHYGLGWRVYQLGEEQIVYHGGWVSGYRSEVAFSAKHKVGFALLLNSEGSAASEMTTTFWQALFASLEED